MKNMAAVFYNVDKTVSFLFFGFPGKKFTAFPVSENLYEKEQIVFSLENLVFLWSV